MTTGVRSVSVAADLASRGDYRLLAMDKSWVAELKRRVTVLPAQPRKRGRSASPDTETADNASHKPPFVALVMKGEERLCASDSRVTFVVRRVEFSNSVLVAERRERSTADAAAPHEESPVAPPPEPCGESAASVAVASLVRLFEAHRTTPQQNIMETLKGSLLSIEELEGLTSHEAEAGDEARSRAYLTFPALVTQNSTSPRELAAVLTGAGALVHRGCVRLLDPAVLHDGLRAVLRYVAVAEPGERSWEAVEQHFCPSAFPRVVIGAVRGVYGAAEREKSEEVTAVDEVGFERVFDLRKVVVGLAGAVFDGLSSSWADLPYGVRAASLPFEAFYAAWVDSLPDAVFGGGVVPAREAPVEDSLALLSGYVVCHKERKESFDGARVWWLARDALPNDIQKRLAVLFAVRNGRYPADVIRAYVEPLLGPEQSFSHTVLRYAREYRVPGEPVAYAPLTS